MARFALSSPDAAVRLDAVREMMRSLDDATVALLRERHRRRNQPGVKKEIATGLALAALDGPDTDGAPRRRSPRSASSVSQDVRNRLALLLDKSPDGTLRRNRREGAAGRGRRACRPSISGAAFYSGIETLFFGLSLGSVLVLIAIGLAITFGVMGVINMAHGELMMLGAYTTYVVQLAMPEHIGISILVAIPAAFIVAGAGRRR